MINLNIIITTLLLFHVSRCKSGFFYFYCSRHFFYNMYYTFGAIGIKIYWYVYYYHYHYRRTSYYYYTAATSRAMIFFRIKWKTYNKCAVQYVSHLLKRVYAITVLLSIFTFFFHPLQWCVRIIVAHNIIYITYKWQLCIQLYTFQYWRFPYSQHQYNIILCTNIFAIHVVPF